MKNRYYIMKKDLVITIHYFAVIRLNMQNKTLLNRKYSKPLLISNSDGVKLHSWNSSVIVIKSNFRGTWAGNKNISSVLSNCILLFARC